MKGKDKVKYYQIRKKFRISAAHRFFSDAERGRGFPLIEKESTKFYLKEYPDENQIHGHTFFIEIVLESNRLDEQGSVINTNKLKGSIKRFKDKYDHSFLLSKNDPIFDKIFDLLTQNKFKVVVIDKEPTGEVLAEETFNFFNNEFISIFPKKEYPKEFRLIRVDIQIGDTTGISYSQDSG
jgi:6-pyruvoyltetrahydropterin/6-carboxytetrahydropterin synthase